MSYKEASAFVQRTGYAKPSQYALFFTGPFDIIPPQASRRLTINCEECFFPSKNIFTADVRHYGNSYKFPYSHEFTNEVTMIFRIGSDFYEKRVFEEWMNLIINNNTFNHEYYDNYTTNIAITQIDNSNITSKEENDSILGGLIDRFKEGIDNQIPDIDIFKKDDGRDAPPIGSEQIVYQCMLEQAYPIGIMELPLGHGSTDTYHRIGVTFTYRKWTSLPEYNTGDIRDFAVRDSQELDASREKTQKQGIGGKIVKVISRGVEQYGPAFRSGSGRLPF